MQLGKDNQDRSLDQSARIGLKEKDSQAKKQPGLDNQDRRSQGGTV
jgi:hypothetical protein